MKQLLFTYGTLRSHKTQLRAMGHDAPEQSAILPGHKEKFVGEYPTVEPDSESDVRGDVFKVSEKDLRSLDDWEEKYTRRPVKTSAGLAYTYVLDT